MATTATKKRQSNSARDSAMAATNAKTTRVIRPGHHQPRQQSIARINNVQTTKVNNWGDGVEGVGRLKLMREERSMTSQRR
jgi:hypothetical protein